jgi:hypothetical protein
MSSDPVPAVRPPDQLPALPAPTCQNCGAPLDGEYCSRCGQRHEPHVHTLGHFASEAFESVTHADSRLWRTIGYLLVKPGFLSREFFSGRRASYLPPFRLYLVISLLFFVVAGLPDHVDPEDFDEGPPTADKIANLRQAADKLEADLPNTPGIAKAAAEMREKADEQQAELDSRANPSGAAGGKSLGRREVRTDLCDDMDLDKLPAGATWGQKALFGFCQKISTMRGEDLLRSFVHNIPRAMFVFLPLLAAVMKLLYWRPKRHYVEHLLFLVHNHAYVFLAMGMLALALNIPGVGEHLGLLAAAVWIYTFYYIFRAMRVFYGQSRGLTFAKYVFIGFTYFVAASVVLAATAVYSAVTL